MGLPQLLDSVRSWWSGPITSSSPELARIFGSPTTRAGVPVDEQSALTLSAVWAAVSIISADVASLPLILYKRTKDNGKTRFDSHPLYELLHDAPNPEMSSMVFRETLQAHVMNWGNGFAEIERNGGGRPTALWPITPNRVTPTRDRAGQLIYRVTNQSQSDVFIPASDMLHIPGLGFDGLTGYSVIAKARESLGLGLATERFGSTFFGNGSTFGGVLSHPQNLTTEVKDAIRDSIDKVHTGVDRAHKFVIVGGGMTYTALGIPPNDAQFLETRKFQVTEVARWYLIPPHKIFDLDRSTNNNIEWQGIEYYTGGLRRWLVRWEQEINRKLISPLERKSQFVEHNVDGLMRGDSVARADYYTKMFNVGAYSINMILEKENQNGIGPAGDAHFVPMNMTTAELAAEGPPEPPPVKPVITDVTPTPKQLPAARDEALDSILAALADVEERAGVSKARVELLEADAAGSKADAAAVRAELEEARATAAVATAEWATVKALHLAAVEQLAGEEATRASVLETQTAEEAVAQARLAEVITREVALDAERVRLEAELVTALEGLTAADMRAAEAEKKRATDAAERATVEASAASITAMARAQVVEAEAQAELVAAEKLTLEAELVAVRLGLTEAERQRAETETALTAEREATQQRRVAVIGAHRALIADAMGRMIRRETEKARRAQATPAKLGAWMESFYPLHAESCRSALLPAMRAHLAWMQSPADPAVVTENFVQAYIAESQRQLRAVLALEDIAAPLETLLRRWEMERAEASAETILKDALDHVALGQTPLATQPVVALPVQAVGQTPLATQSPIHIDIHNHPAKGNKSIRFVRNSNGSLGSVNIEEDGE